MKKSYFLVELMAACSLGLMGCSHDGSDRAGPTDRDSGPRVVGTRDDAILQSGTPAGAARTDNGVSGGAAGVGTRSGTAGYQQNGTSSSGSGLPGGTNNTGAAIGTGATLDNGQPNSPNPRTPDNSPSRP